MKFHRIKAIILHYLYHSKRSLPRIMDIFYWPSIDLLLWGFISLYLNKMRLAGPNASSFLLGAVLLWTIFRRSQQDVAIAFLEDVWYRNLINLFVSPLKISEYLLAGIIVGFFKALFIVGFMALLAGLLYHFSIFTLGFALIPFLANLMIFGWAVGIFTSAIIFRFGTETQILSFSIAFLLQPIGAVFYPLSVLPLFLQKIAWFLPLTHIFEGMRDVLSGAGLSLSRLAWAGGLNLVFLLLACLFYLLMFNKVRQLGLISKIE